MAEVVCYVYVKTGKKKGSSSNANVFLGLYNRLVQTTGPFKLEKLFRENFRAGTIDRFKITIPTNFGSVTMIEFWRDSSGISPDWYVEKIQLEHVDREEKTIFPVFRWIEADFHYRLYTFDTFLPQFDPNKEQRLKEVEFIQQKYTPKDIPGLPIMLETLPEDDDFTNEYKKKFFLLKLENMARNIFAKLVPNKWSCLDDITKIYDSKRTLPIAVDKWTDDVWFGRQRLAGCNPTLITLCTEIPENLAVDDKIMFPVLQDDTLQSLIKRKRLFYIDLKELDGLEVTEGFEVCAPIALFTLDLMDRLIPIAIQLKQEKGPDNPVFLPTDERHVWLLAKMWYNNAESAYHQAVVHFGWNHLLMESIILSFFRNVSASHPVYKLVAPHTLFLMAINSRKAFQSLLHKGGWADQTMSIGVIGMLELVSRCQKKWRFDVHGTVPKEIDIRQVDDPFLLPNYHYRDDALLIYNCIHNYVTTYIKLYYSNVSKLHNDWEMQNWAAEMTEEKDDIGTRDMGLPLKDGKGTFNTIQDLILVLTSVIYISSAGHASTNFSQYEEYAFPPNYPSKLNGEAIKDKKPKTEADIMKALPDKSTTLDIMTVTNILSQRNTNRLGDFETQYIYETKALGAVDKFRADLKEASKIIKERNTNLDVPYVILDPENIPNSISI